MGKRRKISSSTTSNASDPVLPDGISEHKKKTKVSNSKDILKLDDNVNISEINDVPQKKMKKKGNKQNTDQQIPVSEEVSESSGVSEANTETREKKKHKSHKTSNQVSQETVECLPQNSYSNSPSTSKSKKIIFIDDQPQQVVDALQMATKTNKNKNKAMNNEEEEVNDEDIDKFCDELTEEDNVQYESWIKLVEAKMHPNKKS